MYKSSIFWRGAILAALSLAAYRGLLSYPAADASDRPEDTALAPAWAIWPTTRRRARPSSAHSPRCWR